MRWWLVVSAWMCLSAALQAGEAIRSFDLSPYTIQKVRVARADGRSYIVASSYEGTVLAVDFGGRVLWKQPLSGYMNFDVFCRDIDGDANDEIFLANADGAVYCVDHTGRVLWRFPGQGPPMVSVCVVRKADGTPLIAAGGFDKNLYLLDPVTKKYRSIPSSAYSREKTWGKGPKRVPPPGEHSINYLRPVRLKDGSELLAVHGIVYSLSGGGSLYFFRPEENEPCKIVQLPAGRPFGDIRARDPDGDGNEEILAGTTTLTEAVCAVVSPATESVEAIDIYAHNDWRKQLDGNGYRVLQTEIVDSLGTRKLAVLLGSRLLLLDPAHPNESEAEVLPCRYSFYDIWADPVSGKIVLASSQSGGSCIHVIDPASAAWKQAYSQLEPPGKIAKILENTRSLRTAVDRLPAMHPRAPLPVIFMTERVPETMQEKTKRWADEFGTPIFLNGVWFKEAENWDRAHMASETYREKRDRRKQYTATSDEIYAKLTSALEGYPGIAFWGGHGNDPYQISLRTLRRVLEAAGDKLVVVIYPELEDPSDEFAYVLNDLLYPLAETAQKTGDKVYLRTKHFFWETAIYHPMWSRLLSGEFADVFVPSMEETTDKTQELSVAARLGVWAAGCTDDWGSRCARDNPSFDRMRQFSHQMLPNHFLRNQVFTIAYGARYMNNVSVDQEYMSVLWELIAKGVLYVPKRGEIVSFSPVRLGMIEPDPDFEDQGNNVKWTTFFDPEYERNNRFVFERINGSWPGAPLTEWDFSRFAAGAWERRQNFLPSYPHGLVLIGPHGETFDRRLRENLHPLYRDIMQEFVTDGRWYYTPDGKKQPPHTYYRTVAQAIEQAAAKLPVTVAGQVAWVAAVSAPHHIRLTVIDGGYLNPNDRRARIAFHSVTPVEVRDLVTGETISTTERNITVDVPCGLFRFLDVTIREPLTPRE